MRIRKAKKADFYQIISLAKKYNLDYPDIEKDKFWVAEEAKKIVGICCLRNHKDCSELCCLGVEEKSRNRGAGKKLALALLKNTQGEIYLSTIIPVFFEKLGFNKASRIPPSMVKEKDWCLGCNQEACTIMVRENQ